MDDVTDHPYRHIQKKYGNPAVVYTEFTSVEGVCHGAERLLKDFHYDETQRPIVAQVYGTTPEFFRETATLLCELGFDGIDINMGCPAKNVAHSGAGAALIRTPDLAQEIIRATKAGVSDYVDGKRARDCEHITEPIWQEVSARHQALPVEYQTPRLIPVSVKTRVGYDTSVVHEWIPALLAMEPVAIALHGRTLNQRYSGEANWELIGQAAELVHQTQTLIIGNGDIPDLPTALLRAKQYDLHGVLIGRASFGNPYAFLSTPLPAGAPTLFQIALDHARLFEATYQHDPMYNFLPMRKHLGWYVKSIPEARQIRIELFQSTNADQVEEIMTRHHLL
jgi:tRNA-dihydrouridine synthase B